MIKGFVFHYKLFLIFFKMLREEIKMIMKEKNQYYNLLKFDN